MRRLLTFITVFAAALAIPTSVLAGGWAVVVLDQLPVGLENGDGGPHRVGYTVLQHGVHPASGLQTSIAIRSVRSGEVREFSGQAEGAAGHYVAEVQFPSVGEWTWEVRPYPFAAQSLGTVTVLPKSLAHEDGAMIEEKAMINVGPAAELSQRSPSDGSTLDSLRIPLASAAVLAWGLFAWSLFLLVRGRASLGRGQARASRQLS